MQGINLANIFVDSDNDTGGKLTWRPSDSKAWKYKCVKFSGMSAYVET